MAGEKGEMYTWAVAGHPTCLHPLQVTNIDMEAVSQCSAYMKESVICNGVYLTWYYPTNF